MTPESQSTLSRALAGDTGWFPVRSPSGRQARAHRSQSSGLAGIRRTSHLRFAATFRRPERPVDRQKTDERCSIVFIYCDAVAGEGLFRLWVPEVEELATVDGLFSRFSLPHETIKTSLCKLDSIVGCSCRTTIQ